ncbi:MAG TPA: hypothetical protein DCF65_10585, partial [Chloroflexi bacterium]|nr:hypothetical protein [Chloroflexota bacterium]
MDAGRRRFRHARHARVRLFRRARGAARGAARKSPQSRFRSQGRAQGLLLGAGAKASRGDEEVLDFARFARNARLRPAGGAPLAQDVRNQRTPGLWPGRSNEACPRPPHYWLPALSPEGGGHQYDLAVARAPVKRTPATPNVPAETPLPSPPPVPSPSLREGAPHEVGSRGRVAIESVSPEVEGGRFPAKRSVGEKVAVEADIFADGQDALACVIRYRHEGDEDWTEVPMVPLVNDRWRAEFAVTELGRYRFTIEAWVDPFETWSRQFAKRVEAGQDVSQELEIGARLVEAAAASAHGPEAEHLMAYAAELRRGNLASLVRPSPAAPGGAAGAPRVAGSADRSLGVTYGRQVEVLVEPQRARYGAWYEMFPRSAGKEGKHGTFRDVEGWLPYIS